MSRLGDFSSLLGRICKRSPGLAAEYTAPDNHGTH
jgi:hypothetical protein